MKLLPLLLLALCCVSCSDSGGYQPRYVISQTQVDEAEEPPLADPDPAP